MIDNKKVVLVTGGTSGIGLRNNRIFVRTRKL